MSKQNRYFSMSYADMISNANHIVNFIKRDMIEFNERGVSNKDIVDLEDEINAFKYIAFDNVYHGKVIIASNAKKKIYDLIYEKAKYINGFLKQAFGNKSVIYKQLNVSQMRELLDAEFLMKAKKIASVAEEHSNSLFPIGLKQVDIDSLRIQVDLFFNAIIEMGKVRENRTLATEKRIIDGNILYKNIAKLAEIGKAIWFDRNSAKYNDYLIYKNHSPKKGIRRLTHKTDLSSQNNEDK